MTSYFEYRDRVTRNQVGKEEAEQSDTRTEMENLGHFGGAGETFTISINMNTNVTMSLN